MTKICLGRFQPLPLFGVLSKTSLRDSTMKHVLLALLVAFAIACKQPSAPLAPTPTYEGYYQLEVSTQSVFDNYSVWATGKGTLQITKNANGTYSFTEKFSNSTRSYQVTLTGTTFELPIETVPLTVSGITYTPQYTGSGEFKTGSVTINRSTSFKAGSVQVNQYDRAYGYR